MTPNELAWFAAAAGVVGGAVVSALMTPNREHLARSAFRDGYELGIAHFAAEARQRLRLTTPMLGLGDVADIEQGMNAESQERRRLGMRS